MAPEKRYVPSGPTEATAPSAPGLDCDGRVRHALGRPSGAGPNARPPAGLATASGSTRSWVVEGNGL
jgi:hypothetical protein